jgi:hypothetical protein
VPDPTPRDEDGEPIPSCNSSSHTMVPRVDRQSSTGNYWKNCRACRNKSSRSRLRSKARHGDQDTSAPASGSTNPTPAASSTAPPSSITRACDICSEDAPAADFPRLEQCAHQPQVCAGCCARWLTSQVGATSWDCCRTSQSLSTISWTRISRGLWSRHKNGSRHSWPPGFASFKTICFSIVSLEVDRWDLPMVLTCVTWRWGSRLTHRPAHPKPPAPRYLTPRQLRPSAGPSSDN